jgi:hypothetical protein
MHYQSQYDCIGSGALTVPFACRQQSLDLQEFLQKMKKFRISICIEGARTDTCEHGEHMDLQTEDGYA